MTRTGKLICDLFYVDGEKAKEATLLGPQSYDHVQNVVYSCMKKGDDCFYDEEDDEWRHGEHESMIDPKYIAEGPASGDVSDAAAVQAFSGLLRNIDVLLGHELPGKTPDGVSMSWQEVCTEAAVHAGVLQKFLRDKLHESGPVVFPDFDVSGLKEEKTESEKVDERVFYEDAIQETKDRARRLQNDVYLYEEDFADGRKCRTTIYLGYFGSAEFEAFNGRVIGFADANGDFFWE